MNLYTLRIELASNTQRHAPHSKKLTEAQKTNSNNLIAYLEELNEQKEKPEYIKMTEAEQEKYIGDYRYGEVENDGFSVKRNMRKLLFLGKLGKLGGGLNQKAPNVFLYNEVPSVEISFEVVGDKVI